MTVLALLASLVVVSPAPVAGDEDLAHLLAGTGDVETVALSVLSSRAGLDRYDLLVWDTRSRRLPPRAAAPATIEVARGWIEDGGKLLLLSHAVGWLHDLGLESVAPDRRDTRLLGHRDAYAQGQYVYGVRANDHTHPLFRGLEPFGEHPDVFLVAGGHAVRNESCFWERAVPQQADVLGTFFRHGYGEDRAFAHRVLVTTVVGEGRVLAYGCGPLATTANPHRANLARFLANAVDWLCEEERPRIAMLPAMPAQLGVDEYSSDPPEPAPAPWPDEVIGPRLPYIAHWGWLAPIDYQRGGMASADLGYFKEKIIDESARWGANLVEFYAPDMEEGFPWAWEKDDPIPRPEPYWGGAFDPRWDAERTRELTAYAHGRGFLVHSFHHPNPVRNPFGNFVSFTEWAAREFMNARLYGGERAWDGFGWEWFPSDREGQLTAALWKYAPGAYEHSTSVLPNYTPNFSGTLMCAFGRLGNLNACGFSDQWRDVYHPPLYLSYQADCRTKKPSEKEWGGWGKYGGGSYPDWILRQVNDFCRERLHEDSAIWWLGEPESTLHPRYREYVYGITSNPIRAAVACKLWATGRGGYRETIARLSPDPPPGYASGPDLPHQTAILQNNFLRLVRYHDRDGGMLLYDPLHLGRFDPDVTGEERAVVLWEDSPALDEDRASPPIDEPVLHLTQADTLPVHLAYEREGCEQRLRIPFDAKIGLHRLRLVVAGNPERSMVEVRLKPERREEDPIGFYATGREEDGTTTVHTFELGIVTMGSHELVVEVQSGGGHLLEELELRRVSRRAVRHSVKVKAGGVAVLREEVADASRDVPRPEVRLYSMVSDEPSFTVSYRGEGPLPAGITENVHEGWLHQDPVTNLWLAARRSSPPPESREEDEEGGTLRVWTVGIAPSREQGEALRRGERPSVAPSTAWFGVLHNPQGPMLSFIREDDAQGHTWWTQRGSQRYGLQRLLRFHGHSDATDGGRARMHRDPFLPNGFRPGWGCQYVLAFEDLGEPRGRCRVRVAKTGPFVFAPRVEFAEGVRAATVNGMDWRYLDDRHVFLPSLRGDYDVRVEPQGPDLPKVVQTRLTVTGCRWDGEEDALHLTTEPPSWYTASLPGDIDYTMLVETGRWTLVGAEGAEAIPLADYPVRTEEDRATMGAAGIVLRLRPGKAVLRFARGR